MIRRTEQVERAAGFRELHHRGRILVLGNVWDVASALVLEGEGFEALGTTSAGLAASHGFPDRQAIPLDLLCAAVGRIASTVFLPVSVDLEAGYGATPKEVEASVHQVLSAGAVGINLEDGVPGERDRLAEVPLQLEKIEAAKAAAAALQIPIFVNARTDVYFREHGERSGRLGEAIRRSNAFLEGGADGVFVPGLSDRAEIETAVREIGAPLNVLGGAGVPSIPELQELGVARVSVGSGPLRASLSLLRRIGRELLDQGSYASITKDTLTYQELMKILNR